MNGAYLTSLPRGMMRPMAGFPTNGRSFQLARAALDPSTSICKKLVPAIDKWHDRLGAKKLCPDDPIQATVVANAFVQVIMMLRNTILSTHSSIYVCLCILDFKPRFVYKIIFSARLLFCSFFPSSSLFCLPLSFSLLHDDK
jgi:hypothetical protein